MVKFETIPDLPVALYQANCSLYKCKQGKNETSKNYLKRFEREVLGLTRLGGHFGDDATLVHFEMEEQSDARIDRAQYKPGNDIYDGYITAAVERYKAACYLESSDDKRFGQLKADLSNSYRRDFKDWPATLDEAYRMLQTWNNYLPLALRQANINLYGCQQGKTETCDNYFRRFLSNWKLIKDLGGNFGDDVVLVHFEMEQNYETVDMEIHKPGNEVFDKYIPAAEERYKTTVFIMNADDKRFRQLKMNLRNSYRGLKDKQYTTFYDAFKYFRSTKHCK